MAIKGAMMPRTFDILSYAFRPFFLLTSLSGILLVSLWVLSLNGLRTLPTSMPPPYWHGHEMLVGFVMATIAGFTLSAVATWTGRPPLSGRPLAWLIVAWAAGRIAMYSVDSLPAGGVFLLDMWFPLSLCYLFAREVFAARNRRNYKVVAIIFALAGANAAFHLVSPGQALYLLIHTVGLLVALIGGRIIPSFTANWLRGQGATQLPSTNTLIDRMAITLTIVVGIAATLIPAQPPGAYLAFLAALLHALRVSRWHGLQTTRNPLLFILHVAYW